MGCGASKEPKTEEQKGKEGTKGKEANNIRQENEGKDAGNENVGKENANSGKTTEEKTESKKEKKEVMMIVGKPCSGKTFMGDFLATRGWKHVDGDQGNYNQDPKLQEVFGAFWVAMTQAVAGKPVTEKQWKPFYEFFAGKVKEELASHDKVVLTFAILGLFNGEEAYMRSQFPDMKFVCVCADQAELIKRWYVRGDEMLAAMGMTVQEAWAHESNAEARAQFGEEHTDEVHKKYVVETFYAPDTVKIKHDPEKNCYEICNDDISNNQGIEELCKLCGVSDTSLDKEAIAAVNLKRMEQAQH